MALAEQTMLMGPGFLLSPIPGFPQPTLSLTEASPPYPQGILSLLSFPALKVAHISLAFRPDATKIRAKTVFSISFPLPHPLLPSSVYQGVLNPADPQDSPGLREALSLQCLLWAGCGHEHREAAH